VTYDVFSTVLLFASHFLSDFAIFRAFLQIEKSVLKRNLRQNLEKENLILSKYVMPGLANLSSDENRRLDFFVISPSVATSSSCRQFITLLYLRLPSNHHQIITRSYPAITLSCHVDLPPEKLTFWDCKYIVLQNSKDTQNAPSIPSEEND
jgi:hypothetical protein